MISIPKFYLSILKDYYNVPNKKYVYNTYLAFYYFIVFLKMAER